MMWETVTQDSTVKSLYSCPLSEFAWRTVLSIFVVGCLSLAYLISACEKLAEMDCPDPDFFCRAEKLDTVF